jgi:hypothetical protein
VWRPWLKCAIPKYLPEIAGVRIRKSFVQLINLLHISITVLDAFQRFDPVDI